MLQQMVDMKVNTTRHANEVRMQTVATVVLGVRGTFSRARRAEVLGHDSSALQTKEFNQIFIVQQNPLSHGSILDAPLGHHSKTKKERERKTQRRQITLCMCLHRMIWMRDRLSHGQILEHVLETIANVAEGRGSCTPLFLQWRRQVHRHNLLMCSPFVARNLLDIKVAPSDTSSIVQSRSWVWGTFGFLVCDNDATIVYIGARTANTK
jgi:hypothetical protein